MNGLKLFIEIFRIDETWWLPAEQWKIQKKSEGKENLPHTQNRVIKIPCLKFHFASKNHTKPLFKIFLLTAIRKFCIVNRSKNLKKDITHFLAWLTILGHLIMIVTFVQMHLATRENINSSFFASPILHWKVTFLRKKGVIFM